MIQVGFNEPDGRDVESSCRGLPEAECRPRNVRPDHDAIGMREIQRHLPGAASNLEDASVRSNVGIEQLRKAAALRTGTKRGQGVARRIAREGRFVIEATDDVRTRSNSHWI